MSYRIIIEQLALPVSIGVYEAEHQSKQVIEGHIVVTVENASALKSDAIADTLHYGELIEHILRHTSDKSYTLLERLGDDVMDAIEAFHPVSHIGLRLIKRNPKILPHVAGAGVELERHCS